MAYAEDSDIRIICNRYVGKAKTHFVHDPKAYRKCVMCLKIKHLLDFPLKNRYDGSTERHIGCMDCANAVMKKLNNSPERIAERKEQRRQSLTAHAAKRHAVTLKAIPQWADLDKIELVYFQRAAMQKETGVKMHVDHIVPLQGKNVCGLHVENNLRVIPALDNYRKSNKHDS